MVDYYNILAVQAANLEGFRRIPLTPSTTLDELDGRIRRLEMENSLPVWPPIAKPTLPVLANRIHKVFEVLEPHLTDVARTSNMPPEENTWPIFVGLYTRLFIDLHALTEVPQVNLASQFLAHEAGRLRKKAPDNLGDINQLNDYAMNLYCEKSKVFPVPRGPPPPPPLWPRERNSLHVRRTVMQPRKFAPLKWMKKLICFGSKDDDSNHYGTEKRDDTSDSESD